ncbi:TetR/AcrR family transcriptional regulator [Actinoplanes sp. GCM10030250]|uniref:TetR/AcrR family transcriptional regulator n=1 Tax=Actinoplanes sp. GCM10030250 TaxID=3273376 RepID=UPI00362244A2
MTVGRGPKVRAAVLAATMLELADRGYADLTVDGVAQRAGVNKTTVYRRWRDRQSLVADAITDQIAAEVPIPDTGGIDGDLRAFARSLIRTLAGPTGQAIAGTMLAGAARIPEIAGIKQRFFEDRIRRAEPFIDRAVRRGELPAGIDPAELIKTLIAPIYLRLLVTAEPLDDFLADRATAITLAAARAGAIPGKRS